MDRDIFIEHLTIALRAITAPRFYEAERGFQGELLVELQRAIPAGFLPDQAIIEQEHRRRLRVRGLTQAFPQMRTVVGALSQVAENASRS